MNIAQIENNLQKLMKYFTKEDFIYKLLLAYGLPKASITRLQKGNLNLSKLDGELSWKKKVFFKEEFIEDLHITISELAGQIKHDQRFVIVTDYKTLLAIDVKTQDKLDIDLQDLPKHYDFFLPWAGMEKAQHANENPADVKAAEKMAKLFDEIKKDNDDTSPDFVHGLNVFLSRLLFCFFAEDTNIFENGQFTNAINSHTQHDGSDLDHYLNKFFVVLNTPEKNRDNLPTYLLSFPYVNGGLFKKKLKAPKFTRRSRQAIIESGELNWSAINPDIFGSMIQAVITPEHRGGLGMHYTSVPNIMKVIEPLFLNGLYEAFEKSKGNPKKLQVLLSRISNIKIFDPACGSGNFLIIAYKELRRLEIKIIHHLQDLQKAASGFNSTTEQLSFIPKSQLSMAASFQVELFSRIQLSQFYGIELDDFAHEIAQLSLWLAEHQMNTEFLKEFGRTNPTLPLKEAGRIICENACLLNWEKVCPKGENDEIYILGNPPYQGARKQEKSQKDDIRFVFRGFDRYKNLDYIACWFYKGSQFISNTGNQLAFVTTDSICQGEQVELIWPVILELSIEIGFAHESFKWKNNAKANAGVSVVIVGLRKCSHNPKFIFSEKRRKSVSNINPYLIDGSNIIIGKRKKSISGLPKMSFGNMPNEGGYLILESTEKDYIVEKYPDSTILFRKLIGSNEFIKSSDRWCLWIRNDQIKLAESIPEVYERIAGSKKHRLESKDAGTNKLAERPHTFRDLNVAKEHCLIIPGISSERRQYFPIGFLSNSEIVSNAAMVIYDSEMYLFGIIHSKIHNIWVRNIGGTLETRIRYSAEICYNNFPFPQISSQRKQEINQCVFRILEEREKHPEKTLAQLYNPDKMPEGLRQAHRANDEMIEKCYRARPFDSDEERLEYLFKLYEIMKEEEKNRGGLFEKQKKKKQK